MPFCPECNTDYKENVFTCSQCNEDLLPGLVPAQVPDKVDWYVVESVPNEIAGLILKNVLEDEGIHVYLRTNEMPGYAGVKGNVGKSEWGDLLVPTYSVNQALECIKEYYDSIKEE